MFSWTKTDRYVITDILNIRMAFNLSECLSSVIHVNSRLRDISFIEVEFAHKSQLDAPSAESEEEVTY